MTMAGLKAKSVELRQPQLVILGFSLLSNFRPLAAIAADRDTARRFPSRRCRKKVTVTGPKAAPRTKLPFVSDQGECSASCSQGSFKMLSRTTRALSLSDTHKSKRPFKVKTITYVNNQRFMLPAP